MDAEVAVDAGETRDARDAGDARGTEGIGSETDMGRGGGGVVIDTFLFPGCGRSRPPVVITAGERTRAGPVCPAAATESSARRRNR
ncbi:hypothetical protein TPA0910_61940 [Streptomyces hygroscopicus subsp. sporocinereus]|uniref:Uncharacterized protein n=1 Tax=Streptomyces hygroscopicus TaxID=1912 RepID=A0ABQ3U969_STRHY|nr:hypothetical protein TPA0910_61940 [Streptomyces hygroscopicus]